MMSKGQNDDWNTMLKDVKIIFFEEDSISAFTNVGEGASRHIANSESQAAKVKSIANSYIKREYITKAIISSIVVIGLMVAVTWVTKMFLDIVWSVVINTLTTAFLCFLGYKAFGNWIINVGRNGFDESKGRKNSIKKKVEKQDGAMLYLDDSEIIKKIKEARKGAIDDIRSNKKWKIFNMLFTLEDV